MTVNEIHATIDAKRAEQRQLVRSAAQNAQAEARLHQLDIEIHDLKAELHRLVLAEMLQYPANGV